MARLLIVHHTPSPVMRAMFEAAVAGASAEGIEGVAVQARPVLTAAAVDVESCWELAATLAAELAEPGDHP